ncbi:MAG TPA: hypothetical protein VGC72_05545 [Candidatus Elarobacter sp.]|jgi:hypothetical protein
METQAQSSAAVAGANELKKVTVNFAIETYRVLADLAAKQQVTMSEALRRAIKLHAFLMMKLANGDTIIVRKANGTEVELMIGL